KKLDEFLTVNEYPEDFLIVNEYPEDFLVVNEYPEDFLVVNEYPKDFLVVNEANKESEHSGEISSDLVMNKEVMDSEFEIEGYDDMLSQNEIESSSLFSGKQFDTWDECELFLNKWAKNKEFRLIKGHVTWENGFLRRRTYLCDHGGSYESNTVKDTVTKKTQFDTHNHPLDRSKIIFEDEKQFTDEMLADIKFMTESYPRWVVVHEFDDDNTLTHLLWITPGQVEN
ncbi:17182_t:CDS:2, partial [Gigaspora rosea]